MGFTIVTATLEHARGIAQVHVESWRTTYKGIVADATLANMDVELGAQQWLARLADEQPGARTFVAIEDDGRVVGFAAGGPVRSQDLVTDAELYAIYLYKESQRNGIGTALLAEVARYLTERGFHSLGVWVLELNPSRMFYEVFGAELIAEKSLTRDGLTLKELGYRWHSLPNLVHRLIRHSS